MTGNGCADFADMRHHGVRPAKAVHAVTSAPRSANSLQVSTIPRPSRISSPLIGDMVTTAGRPPACIASKAQKASPA